MERTSVNTPPSFKGEGYEDWKGMMKAFISAQDSRAWQCILHGWYPPQSQKEEGSSEIVLKPFDKWTADQIAYSEAENKAMNALYIALSEDERVQIKHCENSKDAWETLENTYEGNKKVRRHKLQLLLHEFDSLEMKDDESVDHFYKRMIAITSQIKCVNAKNTIPQDAIVMKILISLPRKFREKKTAISDAYDLDTYSLQELIGNLKTFEAELNDKERVDQKKSKNIAFKATKKLDKNEQDYNVAEYALLTKEFRKILNKRNSGKAALDSRRGQNFENKNDKTSRLENRENRFENKRNSFNPKCYDCGGVGHLAADCGNKKYRENADKKALKTSWSDDEDEKDEKMWHLWLF
ncbi:uncharacterized protein LOC126795792 [Argentina anserina]|uniref:uncharacterized protein LOC126795792 n=1 Tax=Argentina anserina TaxID=57926 RepID=UPI0021768F9E|nr:uncharacterized protein LOC126795792 [Potentilla anserina]